MTSQKYTIQQLSELSGYSRRTIRYYIQEGIIEPPAGRGRGGFYYDSHLDRMLKMKELQRNGLNLAAIVQHLKQIKSSDETTHKESWVKYSIIDGVELLVREDINITKQSAIDRLIALCKSCMTKEYNMAIAEAYGYINTESIPIPLIGVEATGTITGRSAR
jgi:DNA-binding transcriptional MerR regulator